MANSSINFAAETAGWGVVPSSGWRQVPVLSDGHKTRANPVSFSGIGDDDRGSEASEAYYRQVIEGGDSVLDFPGISNGLGVVFATACDTATSALHTDGTLAHDQTFTWGPLGPPANRSLATAVRRLRKGTTTLDEYTHPGGRCVQLDIGQAVDEALSFKFTMDTKEPILQGSLPARTIAKVDPDVLYNWRDADITVDGAAICATSFNLSLPTGIDVKDECLKSDENRHEPMRKGQPALTGSLLWDYTNPVYYQAWIDGRVMPLNAHWTGPVAIEDDIFPSLDINVGGIRFTGEDPEVSKDDPTKQTLPFEIIINSTRSLVISFVTSDAAL